MWVCLSSCSSLDIECQISIHGTAQSSGTWWKGRESSTQTYNSLNLSFETIARFLRNSSKSLTTFTKEELSRELSLQMRFKMKWCTMLSFRIPRSPCEMLVGTTQKIEITVWLRQKFKIWLSCLLKILETFCHLLVVESFLRLRFACIWGGRDLRQILHLVQFFIQRFDTKLPSAFSFRGLIQNTGGRGHHIIEISGWSWWLKFRKKEEYLRK